MTSSRTRKAGSLFGIDLAGLFRDDDNGEQSQALNPFLQLSRTTKGRGGVLSLLPQQQTGTTATLGLGGAPGIQNINFLNNALAEQQPAQEPAQETSEPTTPELKKFEGTVGGVGIEDIGQKGFGMKDYNVAVAAGYDPESIKEYVQANRANLYNIGPEAQKTLEISDYVNTQPGMFDYSQFGGEGFGMKDVEALESRGVSEEDMTKLAQQAPKIGAEAAKRFGISRFDDFDYGAYGQAGFGMEDVKELVSRGATRCEMQRIAKAAPGGQIGGEARRILGL